MRRHATGVLRSQVESNLETFYFWDAHLGVNAACSLPPSGACAVQSPPSVTLCRAVVVSYDVEKA